MALEVLQLDGSILLIRQFKRWSGLTYFRHYVLQFRKATEPLLGPSGCDLRVCVITSTMRKGRGFTGW